MAGATNFQMEVARNRALVELAEGQADGPGLAFVKSWLAAVDSGRITDPSLPRQPVPKPLKRIQTRPLTNADLDGQIRQDYEGPAFGTADWFAARRKRKAA